MNQAPKICSLNLPTILFLTGGIFSLVGLYTIFFTPTSILTWSEVSELIPVFAQVDTLNSLQLENQLFLIRQSYFIKYTDNNAFFYLFCQSISVIGLIILLTAVQKWSQIKPRQFILGIALWIGIVAYNNSQQGLKELLLVIQQQMAWAGILSAFLWAILSSQAIPAFLIQISFQIEKKNHVSVWFILGLFFWVNLILSFGNLLNYWESNLLIPPAIFLLISAVLFLVQTLKFEQKTQQIGYFGLFLLALSSYFFMYNSQNDPAIKAIETWSMMCQISMALIFPAFIYTNFKELISANLPIFKVFHKAQKLPIYLIHIGIFLLTCAWVFALNTAVFHQMMAGKSNQEGDNAYLLGDFRLAEMHYKNALTHSKLNTKSNLRLAHLAQEKNQQEEEAYYLSNTLVKNPMAETFVALSDLYAKNDHLFESLFNLKKGLELFPQNPYLINQLAINYEKLNQLDSARFLHQKAIELTQRNDLSLANFWYFESKHPIKKLQTEFLNEQTSSDRVVQNNAFIYSAIHRLALPKASISSEFEPNMDVRDWALLYNTSTLLKSKAPLFSYAKWKKNPNFLHIFPEVVFLEAWQNYYHQKPLLGLDQLTGLISKDTTTKSKGYENILGFWKEAQLKSHAPVIITNLASAKKALESQPFNLEVLQKAIPLLNQHAEQKLAYYYALSALRYNEQVSDYHFIYALQALELAEITYAKESMQTLKKLNPDLYQKTRLIFDIKMQEVLKKQRF